MKFKSFALSLLILLPVSFMQAATVYNFNADTLNKGTAFTDTVGVLSATFSSSSDPNGFIIASSFFGPSSALSGNVLVDPGPGGANNLTLSILFSAPQTSISLNFATNSQAGVLFNLNAFNNASAVGGSSMAGVVPVGGFSPEGLISFSGSAFNRVVLSSPAIDFAIDNVTVNAGAVAPEPGTLPLFVLASVFAIACGPIRRGLTTRRLLGEGSHN